MSVQPAVVVNDIHKEFTLPQSKNTSLKQAAVNIVKSKGKVTQKVLDGVSFQVNKGDFFGIVGRNGSGKSTLLKLIAGVYTPTNGNIELHGGLTPFIELGVGFNPELSGRDNIYLNGALLGYNRQQVDQMYDDIVEFAELEPFMGQKLKNYSSGMQVRLAFSIAIKAKNDILIFDEVLAVGDEAFQRKCLDVFEKYKAEGQTVILVTHGMETVRKFCNRAVLIHDGKLVLDGDPQKVADEYSRLNLKQIDKEINAKTSKSSRIKVYLTEPGKDNPKTSCIVNEKVDVHMTWDAGVKADVAMLDLFKLSGEHVTNYKSNRGHKKGELLLGERNHVVVSTELNISPGKYYFNASLRSEDGDAEILSSYSVGEFIIVEDWSRTNKSWAGLVRLEHEWKID